MHLPVYNLFQSILSLFLFGLSTYKVIVLQKMTLNKSKDIANIKFFL